MTAMLDVWCVNTHVGLAIDDGFFDQVRDAEPDVLFMSEVGVEDAFKRLVRGLGHLYRIVPDEEHRVGREAGQTPMLLRKAVFELRNQANPQISPWKGGGPHDHLWPARYGTQARAFFEPANRVFLGRSVHTWTVDINSPKAPQGVLDGHRDQILDVKDWAEGRRARHIVMAGGDWNQDLDGPVRRPAYDARAIMKTAGMFRAGAGMHPPGTSTSLHGPSFLDDVFYKRAPHIHVASHRIIANQGTGEDHKIVAVRFSVRVKS